jgi:uncharacterized protein (DUF1499 family)
MQSTEKKSAPVNKFMLTTIALLLIPLLWIGARFLFPNVPTIFAGSRPANIGIHDGKLAPCPPSPNCVSSFSKDAEHFIAPLPYKSAPKDAIVTLKKVILSFERSKIISETPNYLSAEFSTVLMGFVDDVEFLIDDTAQVIQTRSASRLGESDLGLNRQRLNAIVAKFAEFNK